jgi:hypothetical protein
MDRRRVRSCNQLLALAIDSQSKCQSSSTPPQMISGEKLPTFAFITLSVLHTLLAVAYLLAEQEMFF